MHFCLSGQILPPNLHEIQPQVCMKCVQAGTETQEFTLSKCNIEKKTHTDLFLSGWENAWFSWRQSWFNPYQHVRCYKSWTNLTISISSLEELDKAFVCLGACSVVSFSLLEPIRFPCPWDFPGKKNEMGCLCLPGDLPNSEIEPIVPCTSHIVRQILYYWATWEILDKACIQVIDSEWVSQMVLRVKNLPNNAGNVRDLVWIPGLRRSPWGDHGNPLQYSCLENPMDRRVWHATVCRITQRQIHDWRDLARTKLMITDSCKGQTSQDNDVKVFLFIGRYKNLGSLTFFLRYASIYLRAYLSEAWNTSS